MIECVEQWLIWENLCWHEWWWWWRERSWERDQVWIFHTVSTQDGVNAWRSVSTSWLPSIVSEPRTRICFGLIILLPTCNNKHIKSRNRCHHASHILKKGNCINNIAPVNRLEKSISGSFTRLLCNILTIAPFTNPIPVTFSQRAFWTQHLPNWSYCMIECITLVHWASSDSFKES